MKKILLLSPLLLLFSYNSIGQGISKHKAEIIIQILSHSLKSDKIDTSKSKLEVIVDYETKKFQRFFGPIGGYYSDGIEEVDSQFYNILFSKFDKTAVDIMYVDEIKNIESYASNILKKEPDFYNVIIVGRPSGVDWMQIEILKSLIAHKDNGTDGEAYIEAYKRFGKSTLMIPVFIATKSLNNPKVLSVKQYVYRFRIETPDRFITMRSIFLGRIYIGDLWLN